MNDSTTRPGRIVGMLVAWFLAIALLVLARHVFLLLFGGILFAVFFNRLAGYLHDLTHLPRGVSVFVVIAGTALILFAAFWFRGEQISDQASQLSDQLPRAIQKVWTRASDSDWGQWIAKRLPPPGDMMSNAGGAVARVTGVLASMGGAFVSTFVTIYLTIAIAATPNVYQRGLVLLFPQRLHEQTQSVLAALEDTLWWWLLGRLISMAFVGVATGVGLYLLGVPLAFVLGVFAGLLSFIPNIGPVVSALPAMAMAASQDTQLALYVVALFVGVQIVENYLLDPIIDRKTVYLPPALTIVAQLIMGILAGVVGVTFAAPLIACVMVATDRIYVRGVLGNHDSQVSSE
ncbi:MAG TPA: AI-2E family transporter [Steroidobacteraceae bacterium]|jgi:predicted PurR-regulated permease PerM|nr:AI-2E family transporter [Steroidobacteraceae bacterium]